MCHTDKRESPGRVSACGFVRKLRGGAQAHLLQADDGAHYAVKFANNPQHRRVVISEWLGCAVLRHAGILVPETRIVYVSREFLHSHPQLYFQTHSGIRLAEPGLHFGSRFPGDPDLVAVYDFLPEPLFARIANREDFLGALVFDKWLANADARQAIFYRGAARASGSAVSCGRGYVASMIDNGLLFGGPQWDFQAGPLHGFYWNPAIYASLNRSSLEFWFALVEYFPEEVLRQAAQNLPTSWLDGDEEDLERVICALLHRRRRVAGKVLDALQKRLDIRVEWPEGRTEFLGSPVGRMSKVQRP